MRPVAQDRESFALRSLTREGPLSSVPGWLSAEVARSGVIGSEETGPSADGEKGTNPMMLCLVLLIATLAGSGAPEPADLPKVLFFANPMGSDNDVIRRPRPEVLSVAERHFAELSKGRVRRHDHPGRRRGDPREARPLPGRRLLHGDQSAGRGQGRAHRVGPRRRGVRRDPFHGQHLPGPSRVRRDARRVVRPAAVEDQGAPADEGPGEGRGPDAPGDAAPGGVVRDRRRHLPVQELRPRARCGCC